MALAGCNKVTIVNRSEERGKQLVDLLSSRVREACGGNLSAEFIPWQGDFTIEAGTDVVINATSIGLFPDTEARIALDTESLTPEMVVADVIPNPPKTRLVNDATERGCKVIDGLGMLVAQGVIGIEYWTGRTPDPAVMRGGLEKVFGS